MIHIHVVVCWEVLHTLTFHMWNVQCCILLHCTSVLKNSAPVLEDLTSCILCPPKSLYLQAELYKEDFMKERTDRERTAGRLDSLQRTQVEEMKCM